MESKATDEANEKETSGRGRSDPYSRSRLEFVEKERKAKRVVASSSLRGVDRPVYGLARSSLISGTFH